MISPGDLVRYNDYFLSTGLPKPNHEQELVGVVVKVIDKFCRDDNVLVLWNDGRQWCVSENWVAVID